MLFIIAMVNLLLKISMILKLKLTNFFSSLYVIIY
jgi:hypothetical protein